MGHHMGSYIMVFRSGRNVKLLLTSLQRFSIFLVHVCKKWCQPLFRSIQTLMSLYSGNDVFLFDSDNVVFHLRDAQVAILVLILSWIFHIFSVFLNFLKSHRRIKVQDRGSVLFIYFSGILTIT